MHSHDIATGTAASTIFDVRYNPPCLTNIVVDEPEWRIPPQGSPMALPERRVMPTRWHTATQRTQESWAETPDDCHVPKIALRNMNICLSVAGRTVQDGIATPGMFHVTEPATPVRCPRAGPACGLRSGTARSCRGMPRSQGSIFGRRWRRQAAPIQPMPSVSGPQSGRTASFI